MTGDRRDPLDPAYLRDLRRRDVRDRDGAFLAEGVRFLLRAHDARIPLLGLTVCPELLISPVGQMIVRRHKASGTPVRACPPDEFRALSASAEPQGVLVVGRQRWDALPPPRSQRCATWIALEQVRSPGNLGSILRTAEATGVSGVVLLGTEADPYDPGCLRGGMGAIFGLRLVRSTHERLRSWCAEGGLVVVGASPHARHTYRGLDWPPGVVLAMGGERKGLSRAQASLCDRLVRIPMVGGVDSLNVAVATGVLLYEVFARRDSR